MQKINLIVIYSNINRLIGDRFFCLPTTYCLQKIIITN